MKILRFFGLGILVMGFICGCTGPLENGAGSLEKSREMIAFNPGDLRIDGDMGAFRTSWEVRELAEGLQVLKLKLVSDKPAVPPRFYVKWNFPSIDIHAFWNTNLDVNKVSYNKNRLGIISPQPIFLFMI